MEHRDPRCGHRERSLSFRIPAIGFGRVPAAWSGCGIASVSFFGPVAIVYGILFWRGTGSAPAEKNSYATLLLRMLLISYGLMVLTIVVFRISDVHDRWLQPVLLPAPVLLVAWVQSRLNPARLKGLLAIAAVVMVIVTVGLHARIILAEKWHRTQPESSV